jgi:hypothetical protein
MRRAITPLPNTPSWRGARLKKHREKFTCTFAFTPDLVKCLKKRSMLQMLPTYDIRQPTDKKNDPKENTSDVI